MLHLQVGSNQEIGQCFGDVHRTMLTLPDGSHFFFPHIPHPSFDNLSLGAHVFSLLPLYIDTWCNIKTTYVFQRVRKYNIISETVGSTFNRWVIST